MCLPMISRLLLEYSIDLSHIARSLYALIELARAPGPVVFGRGEEMERESETSSRLAKCITVII